MMMMKMTFKMQITEQIFVLDCKFPITAVQYDGGGSFNKDVKIYTKQGCHL